MYTCKSSRRADDQTHNLCIAITSNIDTVPQETIRVVWNAIDLQLESENESQLKIIEFSPDGETLLTKYFITLWSTGDWSITCIMQHLTTCMI